MNQEEPDCDDASVLAFTDKGWFKKAIIDRALVSPFNNN
jgi:hypothetical protein